MKSISNQAEIELLALIITLLDDAIPDEPDILGTTDEKNPNIPKKTPQPSSSPAVISPTNSPVPTATPEGTSQPGPSPERTSSPGSTNAPTPTPGSTPTPAASSSPLPTPGPTPVDCSLVVPQSVPVFDTVSLDFRSITLPQHWHWDWGDGGITYDATGSNVYFVETDYTTRLIDRQSVATPSSSLIINFQGSADFTVPNQTSWILKTSTDFITFYNTTGQSQNSDFWRNDSSIPVIEQTNWSNLSKWSCSGNCPDFTLYNTAQTLGNVNAGDSLVVGRSGILDDAQDGQSSLDMHVGGQSVHTCPAGNSSGSCQYVVSQDLSGVGSINITRTIGVDEIWIEPAVQQEICNTIITVDNGNSGNS